MRTIIVQIHHDAELSSLVSKFTEDLYASELSSGIKAQIEVQKDSGYTNISFYSLDPKSDYIIILEIMLINEYPFFQKSIIIHEGQRGWEDYTTLHNYCA